MKKTVFLLLFLIWAALPLAAQPSVEFVDAGNPVRFDNTEFYFLWSSHPYDHFYIQEYFPREEISMEHFTRMLSLHLNLSDVTPQQAAQMKVDELANRKLYDPCCSYQVFENESTGEFIIAFVVSSFNEQGILTVMEANVYRYTRAVVGGRNAMALWFYSRRAYEKEVKAFIEDIDNSFEHWVTAMTDMEMPQLRFK